MWHGTFLLVDSRFVFTMCQVELLWTLKLHNMQGKSCITPGYQWRLSLISGYNGDDVINRMLAIIVQFCEQVCIELGLLVRLVLWTFSCGKNNILNSVQFDHQLLQRNVYVPHTWMAVLISFAQNFHISKFVF